MKLDMIHHQSGEPLTDIPLDAELLTHCKMLGYATGFKQYEQTVWLDMGDIFGRDDDFWYCVLPDPEVFADVR